MFRMRPGAIGIMEPGRSTLSTGRLEGCSIKGVTFAAIALYVLEKADIDDMRSFGIFLLAPYLLMKAWAKPRRMDASKAPQVSETLRAYCRFRKARHLGNNNDDARSSQVRCRQYRLFRLHDTSWKRRSLERNQFRLSHPHNCVDHRNECRHATCLIQWIGKLSSVELNESPGLAYATRLHPNSGLTICTVDRSRSAAASGPPWACLINL